MPPAHVFASLLPILVACAMLVATGAAAGAWLARRMSRRGRRPQHRPARPGSRRARREKILAAIAAWKEAGRLLSLEFSVEEARGSLELAGNIQGNRVIVSSFGQRSGKGRVYYTRYRILFPRLLHLGLRLSRERPLGEAPKRPGSETVETGDAAFDGDVAVHSTDPEAVREYLSPERRDRIHRLLKSYPGLVVGDAGISWTAPGLLSEPQEMVTVVRRMTHVAVEMWKTGGDEDGSAAAGGAVPRTEKIPPIPVAKEIPLTSGDPAFAELGAIRDGRELLVTPSAPASAAAPASVSPPAALSRPASGERTRAGSGGQLPAGSILRGSERFSGLSAGAPPIATPASPPPLPAEASIGVVSLASGPASPPPLPAEASIGVVSPAACPPSPPPLGSLDGGTGGDGAAGARPVPEDAPAGGGDSEESAIDDLDAGEMCGVLFDPKLLSVEASHLFAARYEGRLVRIGGRLKSAEAYPFDFVLGSEPGAKAALEIFEIEDAIYGRKKVTAVVQFPAEALEALESRIGQEISLVARLFSVDGFGQHIYLKEGRLQEELAR